MKIAQRISSQMFFPFRRQPGANWDLTKDRSQIDAPILTHTGVRLHVNVFPAA